MAAFPIRIDIDVKCLLVASCTLSTREVGEEWLALLQGKESEFAAAVVRRRTYAAKRLPAPNWQSTRLRIFDRDGHRCTYCGSAEKLECDHVVPVARGGSHDDDNLTTACRSCNRSKRSLLPEEWIG